MGRLEAISAKMQPMDQRSTAGQYLGDPNRTSGALYHRVTICRFIVIKHVNLSYEIIINLLDTDFQITSNPFSKRKIPINPSVPNRNLMNSNIVPRTYLVSVGPHRDAHSPCQSKISQFNHPLRINEQILRFQIPVDDSPFVAKQHGFQNLVHVALEGKMYEHFMSCKPKEKSSKWSNLHEDRVHQLIIWEGVKVLLQIHCQVFKHKVQFTLLHQDLFKAIYNELFLCHYHYHCQTKIKMVNN